MPLPYESARSPGHVSVSLFCEAHAPDGLGVAPPRFSSLANWAAAAAAAAPAVSAVTSPMVSSVGASMARHPLRPAGSVRRPPRLPELGDTGYVGEVLCRPDGTTEADVELELQARAAKLGIVLSDSRRSDAPLDQTIPILASGGDAPDAPVLQHHSREVSNGTDGPADAAMTSPTSDHTPAIATHDAVTEASGRRRSRSLSFSRYDKYINEMDPTAGLPKPPRPKYEQAGGPVAKHGSRKGVRGFTRSLANRLRGKKADQETPMSMPCICCRELFITGSNSHLHTLPCGHNYCRDCLAVIISQSLSDECKMPPKCCTEPIPSTIIKIVLPRDKQREFLKAVALYSTPWETRIFCPNASCGEFIPPATRIDPKHPSEALCLSCKTRVCAMCKRPAHALGQDCPEDHELDRVLKMGEKSGWRRCYKCRTLVELAQGCTHITCRCKAQFCYICGAVWDPAVGCPNFCNGEAELERRRAEEEARLAELEAAKLAREKAAEAEVVARQDAERRTRENAEFKALRAQQEAEMARFRSYEEKVKEAMRLRQSEKKRALLDKFSDLIDKMRDRHARTEQHLEDRQVVAEIELQAHLEEKEKKVRLKLKYMEDYCHGAAGPAPTTKEDHSTDNSNRSSHETAPPHAATTTDTHPLPPRQVTSRDLEQLRQQYLVRDGMARRHRSQIHGLRERQAKSMEELAERHEAEMAALVDRRAAEMEDLALAIADEEELLLATFAERRARMVRRWELAGEVVRVEVERRLGGRFAKPEVPDWPEAVEEDEEVEEVEGVEEEMVLVGGGGGGGGCGVGEEEVIGKGLLLLAAGGVEGHDAVVVGVAH